MYTVDASPNVIWAPSQNEKASHRVYEIVGRGWLDKCFLEGTAAAEAEYRAVLVTPP